MDNRMMSTFVDVYMKLWYAAKPTIAAVHGWCIAGGTDLVLCADIVIAAENATFGYPPSRAWGPPTTAMWVYRVGFERAKRYLLTGDEIPARTAAEIGLILETVPDDQLLEHATALATRMARLPGNQLQMVKLLCNQTAENMGLSSSRTLGTFLDGGRAAYPRRPRLRHPGRKSWLPASGPGARRSVWRLRIPPPAFLTGPWYLSQTHSST